MLKCCVCVCVSVLQHCDPVLLDQGLLNSCGDSQQLESAEAAQVVLHLMVSKKIISQINGQKSRIIITVRVRILTR